MAAERQTGTGDNAERRVPREGASHGVELGWTVFDARERPIGNVADLEGDRIGIDGRPQGHGFFEVPVSAIRSAADGHVYLDRQLEDLFNLAGTSGATYGGPIGGTATVERESGTDWEPVGRVAEETPAQPQGGRATPPTFAEEREQGGGRPNPIVLLGTLGGAAALGVGIARWRRRRARRTRLQRIRRALLAGGYLAMPLSRAAMGMPISRTALALPLSRAVLAGLEGVDRRWLAPLAALPLLLLLRRDGERRWFERAAPEPEPAPEPDWRERLRQELRSEQLSDLWPMAWAAGAWALGIGLIGFLLARRGAERAERPGEGGQRLSGLMTRNVEVIRPDATIHDATSTMKGLNVGFLPVCDGRRLVGVLTDRDIVVRALAEGRDPQQTPVRDTMSADVIYAFDDEPVERAAELMQRHQIRRLPIVDRAKNLVGVVSLGDLAVDTHDRRLSGSTLERISEPSRPTR